MTSLWQNLHNFYVRKFPSLDISNNFTNRNQIIQTFQRQIQKDKIFKIDGGFLGNDYFRNSNSTIYLVDEDNTLYSIFLYPETAEYFARNYNLIIDLE